MQEQEFCGSKEGEGKCADLPGYVRLVRNSLQLRSSVGDGLNDAEFTQLLLSQVTEDGEGFKILCFSEGSLTLSVPPQRLDSWYPGGAALAPEKEEIAKGIAEKFGLGECEPPDRLNYILPPPGAHHHIELTNRCETVAVAHPLYLKVRLFNGSSGQRVLWSSRSPLPPLGELMKELARLYQ